MLIAHREWMDLRTRPLGRTGFTITVVGFGSWGIAGKQGPGEWTSRDDVEAFAALTRAIDAGINWIDTAAIYGRGYSEEFIGRFLTQLPVADRPLIFTKCGMLPVSGSPTEPMTWLEPGSIRRDCENSLRRLRVETLDLLQIHHSNDSSGTNLEDSWGAMVRLQEEGKVRAIGLSNFAESQVALCDAIRHVDTLQPPLSVIRREAAPLIAWCLGREIGVLVYSPLQSGLLTDTFNENRPQELATGDYRARRPEFRQPELDKNLALRDALRLIATRRGVDTSCIAVAWALAWPGVSGAIVGGRSARQVGGWLAAGTIVLDEIELRDIQAAILTTGAGSGPTRPL